MQKTVARILGDKGKDVWSTTPDATVFEALELMAARNVGAVVVAEGDELAGIVSERDYARKVALRGRDAASMLVSEIMTAEVHTVQLETTVSECMNLMTEHRIRHLPVIESGDVVGLVSIGDIVLAVIAEREFMISQLEQYIQS